MISPRTNWEELSREANKDRRRENRVALTFLIEVCGFNRYGRFFTERTTTHDISDGGCKFRLRTEIETDLQPVALWPVEFPERITPGESLP